MFNFKKEKEKAEEQYEELLKSINRKNDNADFVLGEKKDIYEKDVSLDDILNKHK